jgi:hypothetical protein
MTAALPMGGQKITGMADPTVATDGATKNYVDTTTAAFFSTGDVKLTLKNSGDVGWIYCDDGTIGSAGSGATTRANADTQALFTLLFNNISDPFAPIFTSGGGATTRAAQTNAASAWAANCRISITKTLGRTLAIAGNGAGLTARTNSQTLGAETATIAQNQLPNVTLAYSNAIGVNSNVANILEGTVAFSSFNYSSGGGSVLGAITAGTLSSSIVTSTGTSSGNTASINGGVAQQSLSLMQPTVFLNAMIKL